MNGDIPPSQTIYVNNLPEKVKKEELKKSLYAIFSQFGKILDIVCLKTFRLRGQAWVVFADVPSATNALRQMQGFPFYDKAMRIAYGKSKSDAVAKMEGSYVARDKAASSKLNVEQREMLMGRKKEAAAAEATARSAAGAAPAAASSRPAAPSKPSNEPAAPPHKILFVQNLPEATTDMMLSMLFQQFPGYKEVRMIENKPGIAFVEFESDMQATVALNGLNGFKITPSNTMAITYAKK